MMRTCDGTDPNLVREDGKTPCDCGITFDDAHHFVIFPHQRFFTTEEKEQLAAAWSTVKEAVSRAYTATKSAYELSDGLGEQE